MADQNLSGNTSLAIWELSVYTLDYMQGLATICHHSSVIIITIYQKEEQKRW